MYKFILYNILILSFFWQVDLHASCLPPVSKLINEHQWNALFPNRYAISLNRNAYSVNLQKNDFYTYQAFIQAAKKFPQFLSKGTIIQKKRELAAFLANIAHETSGGWDEAPGGYYAWGLYFLEERGFEKGTTHYSDTTKKKFPPVLNQSYHGRGPMQLSWNYNYAQFSEFYYHNPFTLLNDPSILAKDAVVSFASAIWFWVTPQFPKPSCSEIMRGKWVPEKKDSIALRLPGFGAVANIINGGIECGTKVSPKAAYRLAYYMYFCKYFNVDPGENCSCENQRPFGQ